MNRSQMEMLSVKSAIERTIHAMVSAQATTKRSDYGDLYNEACRYMASLFASKQIDRDYVVHVQGKNLEIKFKAMGNWSCLTFMLPQATLPRRSDEVSLREAINKVATKQESLGEPFATVLHENRWDLYSDEPTLDKTA